MKHVPVDVAPVLVEAAAAIEEARWTDAADRLLAAWRDCRSGRIARALAAVDLRLPAPAPLEGKLVRTREEHWHELVKRGDEESLRRALASPWPTHPKEAHARVDALALLTSARISNALLALHRGGQYTSVAGVRVSRAIFHQLIEKDDHAIVEELERFESQHYERNRLGAAVLRRRRPQVPYLSPAGEATLARIEARLAVQERADAPARENLLAAIYAAPHDDGPRIVYADVLSEAGDPRGEFITLQIQRAPGSPPTRRETKLLRAAGRAWLDGLDHDGATKIVHERGFPAIASLSSGEIRAPGWATIETLFLERDHPFRGAPHLHGLRALHGLGVDQLATAQLPSYELELLSVRDYPKAPGIDTPFAPRVLGLTYPNNIYAFADAVRALRGGPLARRLETVRLGASIRELGLAVALAQDSGFAIELSGYWDLARPYQWSVRVTGTAIHAHWAGSGPYGDVAFESIVPILSKLAIPRLEILEVTGEALGLERVQQGLLRLLPMFPRLRVARILGSNASGTN